MHVQGRHKGIVLKTGFPKKWGVALVDLSLGRINGLVLTQELSHGSLISYEPVQNYSNEFVRLDYVRVENMPLALAAHDLLFLHHVLELCYQFIPVGSCVSGVFDLLLFLYSTDSRGWDDARKLLFLF